ncbi:PREDICTED: carbon catabolite repressor protein 4 homolog 5 isoform X4 [Lupinus angustifolius]|uniref:carbon catabolite repressor protein 4 homolog 5 isoform X4 n=1 Tax=Lupinus angustifolius TaxID=3871 RepID=UPI00092E3454|nr:PREDICTED: carbon catabolite repressor protein 4 homolog 5 isoform X4 [Lupinus angustifolius]
MASRSHRKPPPENSNAGYHSKRRIPYQLKPSALWSHTKRRRFNSNSQTVTPDTNNPSRSNRFEPFRSSSKSRRKKRDEKSIRSSIIEDCSSRRWAFSSTDCSNYKDKVVVVSYNILGVDNASKHMDLYPNVPRSFLDWDRRKGLILEEIDNYSAGILCFQEVDHFNDLDYLFQNNGFKGVYKARTGEALDGCAVFWKDNLFTLLDQEDIEFQRFGLRNNVAQLCVLEVKDDELESDACALTKVTSSTKKRRFVIGNIHVLFNPNRGDIKLGQVRLLLDKAYKLSQKWGSIPVIIAGDLNSVPQSPIYEFLASSKLDIQLHNRRNISGQLDIQSNSRVFRSQIGDEARHSEELVPVKVLETMPIDILKRTRGLPTEKWGSDHLALVCEFAFVNNGNVS